MRRRQRRNNPSVSNTLGWVVLGIGAVVAYEIYKNGSGWLSTFFDQFKPGSGPTTPGTVAYEALTGNSPCAPTVSTGSIVMPDGTIVPANCYDMIPVAGAPGVAMVNTNAGAVYINHGNVNAQGDYIASTTLPACTCVGTALQAWCCNQ